MGVQPNKQREGHPGWWCAEPRRADARDLRRGRGIAPARLGGSQRPDTLSTVMAGEDVVATLIIVFGSVAGFFAIVGYLKRRGEGMY